MTWASITARQVARRSVDLPPIFGPVSSSAHGCCPAASSPRLMSLGTWPFSLFPTAYGCHKPLIQSLEGLDSRRTGLHMEPFDEITHDAKDCNTSMRLSAWMTWDQSAAFPTNCSIRMDNVSASDSFTSWSCLWVVKCKFQVKNSVQTNVSAYLSFFFFFQRCIGRFCLQT